jgi:hypothetical protein
MRRRNLLSTTALVSVVGGFLFVASAASAADLTLLAKGADQPPAVDAFNAKFEALGGSIGGKNVYGTAGSLTFPFADYHYGAQVDGNVGNLDGSTFGSFAGHLFWRDPRVALLGIYANYTTWDRFGGVRLGQVAAEGEYFYGRFTLQGILGIEFGNSVSSTQGFTSTVAPGGGGVPGVTTFTTITQGYDIGTRFFDQINLKYYLGDNINAYVGHRYLGGKNAAAFGGEFAVPVSRGVLGSAFVEARVGEGDFHGIWGGLKFYFGPTDKPLIARQRQEDPNNWNVDTLFSILNNHTSSGGTSTQQFCNSGDTLTGGTCVTPES